MKKIITLLLAVCIAVSGCSANNSASSSVSSSSQVMEKTQKLSLEEAQELFIEKVDTEWGYNVMEELTKFKTNEDLGYRTAGSKAETEAGDYIKETMEAIGMTSVEKEEYTLDGWTFDHANLTFKDKDGKEKTAILGGYQTNFETNGKKEYEVVYANQGTEADFKDLDVKDKLVLIDINQRENWWINYPVYEAYLNGAAAVLAVQDGDYAEISDEALNAQDFCGPEYTPAFSISRKDADSLLKAIKKSGKDTIKVDFDASSKVEKDTKSYNITGMIEGRDKDKMIVLSGHYDGYFDGFQDNASSVAIMLGIAKAIVDSGYQSEKTLVFCATSAEEWGVENSKYDWLTGAYNEVFKIHPEWSGKVIANINFEMPAHSLDYESSLVQTSYELAPFVENIATTIPKVDGVFEKGTEVSYPIITWTDSFAFSIAGIPSSVSRLREEFSIKYYHSQFDNKDTYNEAAFRYNHYLYGTMLLGYDYCAVSPLDFSLRFKELKKSIDSDIMEDVDFDITKLEETADKAIEAAEAAYDVVEAKNNAYKEAVEKGDYEAADKILDETSELYSTVFEIFKKAEDDLVRLTWEEEVVFPHQIPQSNLDMVDSAIDALEDKDGQKALDEYLWAIDNNWYAYDFSEKNYTYFSDIIEQDQDVTQWGYKRVISKERLYDTIHSIMDKCEAEDDDFSDEIKTLKEVEKRQNELLESTVSDEIKTLEQLTETLNSIK